MVNNLEYYKNFYYVGKYKSFTSAAEQLCISQPAISQSIRQLEKKLECKLFVRTSKGVQMTPEGEVLFSYVEKGMDAFEMGETILKKIKDLDKGEIRIGASDMTLQFFLLPYLERFHERFPNIKVKVTNATTPETLENLVAGKIDFGVVSSPFHMKDQFVVENVMDIQDTFVVGHQLKELTEQAADLKLLEKIPVICLEENSSTRQYLDHFLAQNDVSLTPEFELATSDMIVQFALRNLGIGCVMREFAKKEIEQGNLFEVPFKKMIPGRHFSVIYHKKGMMSLVAKKMLEMILTTT